MAARSHVWPDPRVKPPFGTFELDRGHPLGAFLVAGFLLNERGGPPMELVRKVRSSVQGSPTWMNTKREMGRRYGAAGDVDAYPSLDILTPGPELTLVAYCSQRDGSTWGPVTSGGYIASKEDANAGSYDWAMLRGGTDQLRFIYGAVQVVDSGLTAIDKDFFAITASPSGQNFQSGNLVATTAGVTLVNNQKRLTLGGRFLNPTYDVTMDGVLNTFYWFNKAFTFGQLAWLKEEPYSMFRPVVRRRYFTGVASPSICIPSFPSLPAAGGTFTDNCFGTRIVRVTDSNDCQTAEGSISTIRAFSRNPTNPYFVLLLRGGSNGAGKNWLYQVNANSLAITKVREITASNGILLQQACWDWSGSHDNRLTGIVQDNTDANRGFRWYDVVSDTGGDLVTSAEALTALRITGTVASATSSTVFVGNQTDSEAANDLYNGMTLTFTSGALNGETQTISTSTSGKQFTMSSGFSGTPGVGDAFRINYIGYQGNGQISVNGRYLAWWVSEGNSIRGQGQDTARTMLFYDTQTSTLTKHILTSTETTVSASAAGGIHNLQLTPDGQTVVISGFVSNKVWLWATSTNTVTGPYDEVLHHEVTDDRWVQEGWGGANSQSRDWVYRLYATPTAANTHVFNTWPLKGSTPMDNTWDQYITMNHLDQAYMYTMIRHDIAEGGWSLDSGSVYKKSWPPNGSYLPLISANDPFVRFNGAALTLAANRGAMTAGTFFDDNAGLLYVWGPNSEKLDGDTDQAFTVNTGTSTTVFTATAGFPAQTDGYYVGRLLDFNPSGTNSNNSNAQSRITAYTAATRQFTVSPALPITPVGTGTGTVRANRVEAFDWRPYLNELVKFPLNGSTPTRLAHHFGFNNASGMSFDQNGVINSNSDGNLVMWISQYNGDLRRDAFILTQLSGDTTTTIFPIANTR